jgi:CDP-diacylglycerol---serine O-phosphatidyltransferase
MTRSPLAAGALIATSVIADTFDGRFARLFARSREECEFGAQLDSLSDAIAFGVAPALCMTLLGDRGSTAVQLLWWFAVAVFAACAITRLAFYNVARETSGFVGLPAPIAALVWSSVLLAHPGPAVSITVLLAIAAAMVVPLRIPRPQGATLAIFVMWPLAVLVAHVSGSWTG